jgi:hypothetical protein
VVASVRQNARWNLCTTMPWTIWTALMVLWGVCWMFPGPDELGRRSQDLEVNLFAGHLCLDAPSNSYQGKTISAILI